MKIHLRQIPAEGLHLEGEEPFPLSEVAPDDVKATGALQYSLDIGITEGSLWANGNLSQPVELACVRCLEPFPFTIQVPSFAFLQELKGPELFDLTPFLREDVILNLPSYPHCDREGGRVCPAKGGEPVPPESGEAKEKLEHDRAALNKLKLKP